MIRIAAIAAMLLSFISVLSVSAQTKSEGDMYLAGWKCILETDVRSNLTRLLGLQSQSVAGEKDFSVIYSGNVDWNTFKLYLAYSRKFLGINAFITKEYSNMLYSLSIDRGVDNEYSGYDVSLDGLGLTVFLPFFSANIGVSVATGQNTYYEDGSRRENETEEFTPFMVYQIDLPKLTASLELKIVDMLRQIGSLKNSVEQRFLAFPILREAGEIKSLLWVFRRVEGEYYAFPNGEKTYSAAFDAVSYTFPVYSMLLDGLETSLRFRYDTIVMENSALGGFEAEYATLIGRAEVTFGETGKLSLEASYSPRYYWGMGFSCGLSHRLRNVSSRDSISTTLEYFFRANDYRKNNLKTLGMLSPEWDSLNTGVSIEVWY